MSIEKIIQESINKNPLGMKEALEEELRNRLALALEAKMKKESDDEDDMDDEDEEDMDESFNLSDLTLEELEDFMVSEDFDQLDEISKKKVADYMDKSHSEYKRLQQKGGAAGGSSVMNDKQKRRYATGSSASDNAYMKATGRARVKATD